MNFTIEQLIQAITKIKKEYRDLRELEPIKFFQDSGKERFAQFNKCFPESLQFINSNKTIEEEKAILFLRLYAFYCINNGRFSTSKLIGLLERELYILAEKVHHKTPYETMRLLNRSCVHTANQHADELVAIFEAGIINYLAKVFSFETALQMLRKSYLESLLGLQPKTEISHCTIV